MKPKNAQSPKINPIQDLRLAEQAKVVEKLSKLAILEEEFHGKASDLTHRRAKAAVTKLGKMVGDLPG